tara:strand:- start:1563 stop:1871 length:309 start_codon:yes stop_codon:yes gene_type:complete
LPLGNPIDLSCPHAVAIFDRFAPDGAAKHGRRAVALASGAKLLQASFPKLSREKSSTHPRRKADRPSPLMRRAIAAPAGRRPAVRGVRSINARQIIPTGMIF